MNKILVVGLILFAITTTYGTWFFSAISEMYGVTIGMLPITFYANGGLWITSIVLIGISIRARNKRIRNEKQQQKNTIDELKDKVEELEKNKDRKD
jgi:membrane protein implicated in regulation of membrane protease activity